MILDLMSPMASRRLTPYIPPKTASVGATVLLEPSTASYSLG
jgi:hypothetical protein